MFRLRPKLAVKSVHGSTLLTVRRSRRRVYFQKVEMDEETGLYYYGARYLDPKYSRWLSGDPALGDYIPKASINDEAKKHNENLPGMGGVYNTVNLHLYHYAGNNPVKYTDSDGKITVVANNNLLNILQQATRAVGVVGTAAATIMSSPVGMAAGIVIVTGTAVMFVDQHYLDGAIGDKLADGVDFIADKTKVAASWVSGKTKEAGTWIGDTLKSAWDNIFQSNNNDKLKGKPGEIKRNGKQETKIGQDGKAIKERHNTDHGNPKLHTNPHDHDITWDEEGNPVYSDPINYLDDAPPFE